MLGEIVFQRMDPSDLDNRDPQFIAAVAPLLNAIGRWYFRLEHEGVGTEPRDPARERAELGDREREGDAVRSLGAAHGGPASLDAPCHVRRERDARLHAARALPRRARTSDLARRLVEVRLVAGCHRDGPFDPRELEAAGLAARDVEPR